MGRRGRCGEGLGLKLLDIGLERNDFVGSHSDHGCALFVFGLEFINTRLKLVVPLLLLGLASFDLYIFSSQGSYFLGLRLELALNSS